MCVLVSIVVIGSMVVVFVVVVVVIDDGIIIVIIILTIGYFVPSFGPKCVGRPAVPDRM